MKEYELSVLFHPDLEMNPDPALDKVRKTISQAGGKIINEENEGKKRLSYKIGDHAFALYYYADVSLPSDAPSKINSALGIADEVIRCLLVRTDARKAKFAKRRTEAEAHDISRAEVTAAASSDDTQNNVADNSNQKEDK